VQSVCSTVEPGAEGVFVQVVSMQGRLALGRLGASLDALHDDLASRVEVRRPWLESWIRAFPRWDPWIVGVQHQGRLRAVAPLARRTVAGCIQVVSICHSDQDVSPLVSASAADAELLVDAIRSELDGTNRPWRLHLRQLDVDGAEAEAAKNLLVVHQRVPGVARLELAMDGTGHVGVSRNMRSSAARHGNRLARSEHDVDGRWVSDPAVITRSIDEILWVHHARDLELRGRSALSDAAGRSYYLGVVRAHLDQLELYELRLDGVLAAYSLCVRDGGRLFVFDNRMNPTFARFAPGLLANVETVRRAVEDPGVSLLDWGSGEQQYKLSASNRVVPSVELLAWSSPLFRRAARARRDAAHAVRSLRRGNALAGTVGSR